MATKSAQFSKTKTLLFFSGASYLGATSATCTVAIARVGDSHLRALGTPESCIDMNQIDAHFDEPETAWVCHHYVNLKARRRARKVDDTGRAGTLGTSSELAVVNRQVSRFHGKRPG